MAIGCRLLGHKWGRWKFGEGYIDTSYGLFVPSTGLVRICERCSYLKLKSKYGLDPKVARRMYSAD